MAIIAATVKGETMADRLIYAEDLKHPICMACNHEFSDEPCSPSDCFILRAINEAERIDAVQVVRCKDCIHWETTTGICYNPAGLSVTGISNGNNYCSYGKRKEIDDND